MTLSEAASPLFLQERKRRGGLHAVSNTRPDATSPCRSRVQGTRFGRAKLRWGLSIVTLILFFGFIALISTAKSALGANVAGSDIPLGLALGLTVIVLVVLLTAFYVQRSNSRFDELARGLNRRFGQ